MFRLPVLFVANLVANWLPLQLPWGNFLGLRRCCLPGLESLTFPPNKITLYFQVVTLLFFSKHCFQTYCEHYGVSIHNSLLNCSKLFPVVVMWVSESVLFRSLELSICVVSPLWCSALSPVGTLASLDSQHRFFNLHDVARLHLAMYCCLCYFGNCSSKVEQTYGLTLFSVSSVITALCCLLSAQCLKLNISYICLVF